MDDNVPIQEPIAEPSSPSNRTRLTKSLTRVFIVTVAPVFWSLVAATSWIVADDAAAKTVTVARLPAPKVGVQSLLANTESYLKPSARDEMVSMIGELQSRGLDDAAKRLREQLTTTDDDFERLVRKLLAHRAIAAGQATLRDWQRRSTKATTRQQFYSAVLHFAAGEVELAGRDLDRLDDKALDANAAAARLLKKICEAERRGIRIGVERNPWSATFIGPSGKYEAGVLTQTELAKIDPDATNQMTALVALVPLQGNLWGLMGELCNVAGDVAGAAAAFRRAEALAYTPRLLLEHRRILDDYLRLQQAKMIGAAGTTEKKAESPIAKQVPEQLKGLPSLEMGWVVGIGGAVVAVLAALQLREWFRKPRRKQ